MVLRIQTANAHLDSVQETRAHKPFLQPAETQPAATCSSSKGSVLITGAAGFLGSALVLAFLRAGYSVRAMVRDLSNVFTLPLDAIECVEGDVCNPESLDRACRGQDYVVHAAADYRLWTRDPEAMFATNCEGSANVLAAAQRAGVGRIVYTSSVAVLQPSLSGVSVDERALCPLDTAIGPYKKSKVLAHRRVLQEAEARNLNVVCALPSTPIGPRDHKPTPTGRIILEVLLQRMPASVRTGLNFAHVDDIAHGHVLALERGSQGESYILGGQNVSLDDFLKMTACCGDVPSPKVVLPHWVVYPYAWSSELYAYCTGKAPLATRDSVKMSKYMMFFDDSKARRCLGYTARPYAEGIEDAIDWFSHYGYVS